MNKKEKQIIRKVCREIRPTFISMFGERLIGGCWDLSFKIQKELFKYNIDVTLIEGAYKNSLHYWLEYKGNIVDVTATQFNIGKKSFPKILIKPISRLNQFHSREVI